jgi:polyphosphate kinase 2
MTCDHTLPDVFAPPHGGIRDDRQLTKLLAELSDNSDRETIRRNAYFEELFNLQRELVKLQEWVFHKQLKLAVIFEGRDAAGKGGVIRRITQRLNPRTCRTVALPAPDEREKSQWYFQRYVPHLPAGGEIVLFDRSWYNRAGVEPVMGFCTDAEYEDFLQTAPEFERMLMRSGIIIIKYWFSISYEEQYFRLRRRAFDPLKRWKLSPMDIESQEKWGQYSIAKNIMFERTHSEEAPWWIVDAVDKRKARLNCIHHLLGVVPYGAVDMASPSLPPPKAKPEHARLPIANGIRVPTIY